MTDTGFQNYVPRRTWIVWVVLVIFTCTTWAIGGHQTLTPTVVTAVVLAIALIKVRFIGADFMELRTAPTALKRSFDLYVIAVYVGLLAMYVSL